MPYNGEMAGGLPSGEQLWWYLMSLRGAGYLIDIGQISACMKLLAHTQTSANQGVSPVRFLNRLIPVLATSPETADQLRQYWTELFSNSQEQDNMLLDSHNNESSSRLRRRLNMRLLAYFVLMIFAFAMMLQICINSALFETDHSVTEESFNPLSTPGGEPINRVMDEDLAQPFLLEENHTDLDATEDTAGTIVDLDYIWINVVQVGGVVIPGVLLALWALRIFRLRSLRFSQQRSNYSHGVTNDILLRLSLDGSSSVSTDFDTFEPQLWNYSFVPSAELDACQSIQSMINRAGYFLPVKKKRRISVEFVFIIEKQSRHDHQAALDHLYVNELRKRGVCVRAYFYSGDPRLLSTEPSVDGRVSLVAIGNVANESGNQRLILLSTLDSVRRRFGRIQTEWLEPFHYWRERALLDPRSRTVVRTDYMELVNDGWIVETSRERGILRTGARFSGNRGSS